MKRKVTGEQSVVEDIEKFFWLAVYIDTCGFLVLRAGGMMIWWLVV